MWLEHKTLYCKFLIAIERALLWNIFGLHDNRLMDLKVIGFLPLGGPRTLFDVL